MDVSGGGCPAFRSGPLRSAARSQRRSTCGGSGEIFGGFDIYYRDDFSSSPSPSLYLNVDGYSFLNARIGFRAGNGWSGYLWARNVLDEEYFEQLLAAPAGSGAGHFGAVLGDARTYGVTFRFEF